MYKNKIGSFFERNLESILVIVLVHSCSSKFYYLYKRPTVGDYLDTDTASTKIGAGGQLAPRGREAPPPGQPWAAIRHHAYHKNGGWQLKHLT